MKPKDLRPDPERKDIVSEIELFSRVEEEMDGRLRQIEALKESLYVLQNTEQEIKKRESSISLQKIPSQIKEVKKEIGEEIGQAELILEKLENRFGHEEVCKPAIKRLSETLEELKKYLSEEELR